MADSSLDMRFAASLVIGICVLVLMIATGVGLAYWGHRLLGRGEYLGSWGRGLAAAGLIVFVASYVAQVTWGAVSRGFSSAMMALSLGGCGLMLLAYIAALITLLVGESRLGARSARG